MSGAGGEAPSALDRDGFLARFSGVYEHAPWVAAAVWDAGEVSDDPAALAAAMARRVDAADAPTQLALLRAHPDLAGRLAREGALSPHSAAEQAGAGLDRLSPEELAEFQALNAAYQAKFGFPFIIAVRGLTRGDILAAFRARLGAERDAEVATALAQVHLIARKRLDALAGA